MKIIKQKVLTNETISDPPKLGPFICKSKIVNRLSDDKVNIYNKNATIALKKGNFGSSVKKVPMISEN